MSVLATSRLTPSLNDQETREEPSRIDLWWLVPLAVAVFVFIQLDPSLLFSNTTTTGGDTGAHYMVPYFVEHNLLPHFRITGWSPQWYDGYPILTFYFPLPSLLVALLNVVIPYGIAFKLITVSGSLLLPFSVFALAKAGKLPNPLPAVLSLFSLAYLLNTSYTIDGGNIASTLAGEFSFSLSLSIGLFFLATVVSGLGSRRRMALAGLLYGLCALAHILPAIFVAVAAVIYVLLGKRLKDFARLVGVGALGIGVIAFWIVPFAAFLSFSTSMGWQKVTQYSQNLLPTTLKPWILLALAGAAWSLRRRNLLGITLFVAGAISAVAFIVMPNSAIYNARALPFWTLCIYLLAGVGAYGLVRVVVDLLRLAFLGQQLDKFQRSGLLGRSEVVGGSHPFFSAQDLDLISTHDTAGATDLVEESISHRSRIGGLVSKSQSDAGLDPFIFADGGSVGGSGEPFRGSASKGSVRFDLVFRITMGVLVALILVVGVLFPYFGTPSWAPLPKSSKSFLSSWVSWNYSGYEGKAAWPEYSAIMAKMSAIGSQYGCGRAMWEYNSEENSFGTPMALMLLPYWTNNCVNSMEGLFFESSATTPYHFLNQSELSADPSDAMSGLPYAGLNVPLGVQHLQLLGVRYFMAYTSTVVSQANKDPNLRLIAKVGPAGSALSSPANARTWSIYLVKGSAQVSPLKYLPAVLKPNANSRVAWLNSSVAWYQNPSEWHVLRAASGPATWPRVSPGAVRAPQISLPANKVSAIVTGTSTISFNVSRPGVPVYVKTSYFPDWKVVGGSGPYRVSPNLMVVVPTQNHVHLYYGVSPIEKVSDALTIATVLLMLAMVLVPGKFRSTKPVGSI